MACAMNQGVQHEIRLLLKVVVVDPYELQRLVVPLILPFHAQMVSVLYLMCSEHLSLQLPVVVSSVALVSCLELQVLRQMTAVQQPLVV